MNWKAHLLVSIFLLFFLGLIIVGTNVSAQQLAIATDKDITPPFFLTPINNGTARLDLLGERYQLSVVPIRNSYSVLKSSIQNSWVIVEFNLAPRVDYLRYHLYTGVHQLVEDLAKIVPDR